MLWQCALKDLHQFIKSDDLCIADLIEWAGQLWISQCVCQLCCRFSCQIPLWRKWCLYFSWRKLYCLHYSFTCSFIDAHFVTSIMFQSWSYVPSILSMGCPCDLVFHVQHLWCLVVPYVLCCTHSVCLNELPHIFLYWSLMFWACWVWEWPVEAVCPTDAWEKPYMFSINQQPNDPWMSELRILQHSFDDNNVALNESLCSGHVNSLWLIVMPHLPMSLVWVWFLWMSILFHDLKRASNFTRFVVFDWFINYCIYIILI
jgi:hypothetical protein